MTDSLDTEFQDPLTAPFWAAAAEHRLVVQRCSCGASQLYPRPFCLACLGDELTWVDAVGTGTVYSQTVTRLEVVPELVPPYIVALVELDEGPQLLTNVVGASTAIGDRVRVSWRRREHGPPLPVFKLADG